MTDIRKTLGGLAVGAAVVFAAVGSYGAPPPELSVSEWAEKYRIVSPDSQSPWPGPWSHSRAPLAIEPMDCFSDSHPSTLITILGSAQTWKSEVGLNFMGWVIDHSPGPSLIVLPGGAEVNKYSKLKLGPTIKSTPRLFKKVAPTISRSGEGSTTQFKKFPGGDITLVTANTSTGLQMISIRYLICEEVAEWPVDSGRRGDPLKQAIERTTAYENRCKIALISTPGIKGTCKTSKYYEDSDQRKPYAKCPHCGSYQVLDWKNFRGENERPYKAHFICPANGCIIEHSDKHALLDNCVWVQTFPGDDAPGPWFKSSDLKLYRDGKDYLRDAKGREPGFWVWRVYSAGNSWNKIWSGWLEDKDNPETEMVFYQQVLGLAWEAVVEVPDTERLLERREAYPLRTMPPGAVAITGFADVQHNRLEYGVYAWGPGMESWLIDHGVIIGDPSGEEVWAELDKVIDREYELPNGKTIGADAFGVDAGYLSNVVYNYVRGRPKLFAMDGRGGWTKPMMGMPTLQDVTVSGKKVKKGVKLWPTGTWVIKNWIYGSLKKTIKGPNEVGKFIKGTAHFPMDCGMDFFKQMTAEHIKTEIGRDGFPRRIWAKIKGRANEALDIFVGARALASHLGLDRQTMDQWAALAEDRGLNLSGDQVIEAKQFEEVNKPTPRKRRRGGFVNRRPT